MVSPIKSLNQDGFSLVEVMVATGLLALAVLANMSVGDLVIQQKKYEISHSYLNGLYSSLSKEISSSVQCTKMFAGKSLAEADSTNGQEFDSLKRFDNSLLKVGTVIPEYGVKPLKIRAVNPITLDLNDSMRLVQIKAQFEFESENIIGGKTRPEVLLGSAVFEVDSANIIKSCEGSLGSSHKDVCVRIGCTFENGTCQCPMRSFQCPTGQLLMEIRAGVPVCVPLGNGKACPPNTVVTGLGPGALYCRQVPGTIVVSVLSPTPSPAPPPPLPTEAPIGVGKWVKKGCCGKVQAAANCSVTIPTCQGPMLPAGQYTTALSQHCSPVGSWMSTVGSWPVLQSSSAQCE